MSYRVYLILLYLNITAAQINFYYTDDTPQENCLHLDFYHPATDGNRRIVWYCIGELPSKLNIGTKDQHDRFTFIELSQQNITSQDLYQWSASIDVAERYQFYLDQLSISINDTILANEYFYNCTWPNIGPICQYEFKGQYFGGSVVFYLTYNFYNQMFYHATELTCYKHLKCDRGPLPACLDWSEICNGKIDCLDGGLDEKYCWELEINECEENEYRCRNGQCIMQLDPVDKVGYGCLDDWYGLRRRMGSERSCSLYHIPSINCEDLRCYHTAFTSSCLDDRTNLLKQILFFSQNLSIINSNCSSAFMHVFKSSESYCENHGDPCQVNQSIEIVNKTCPSMMSYPNIPLSVDLVFVYLKPSSSNLHNNIIKIPLICYTKNHYNDYFTDHSKIYFQNMTCINSLYFFQQYEEALSEAVNNNIDIISYLLRVFRKYDLNINYTSTLCNQSNLYTCINSSKCISIYRLLDRIYDCPFFDDENINLLNHTKLSEQSKKSYFKCQISNKYIHHNKLNDDICDCGMNENGLCEDTNLESDYKKNAMLFQNICDRLVDVLTVEFDGQNLTDETECEYWECNNIYTRCDGFRNCLNGADELRCDYWSLKSNCSSNHHLCVSIENNQFTCLPLERINDGIVDCLGGFDEITLCEFISEKFIENKFYCKNQSSYSCIDYTKLCDTEVQCQDKSDEKFCLYLHDPTRHGGICKSFVFSDQKSDVEEFLCEYYEIKHRNRHYFRIDQMIDSFDIQKKIEENISLLDTSISQTSDEMINICNRGVDLFISSNNSLTQICLCPPMYYGSRCQYQNQRVSLTMKFRALSDSWQTVFAIVVSLIDDSNQRIIHSYEQFTYSLVENCQTKYDFYLVYATRPKDPLKNYSIHVDIYEKDTLNYRGSSLFPIYFGFLPVHRLTFFVDIPRTDDKTQSCSNKNCVHGKCIIYTNHPYNRTFCQCNEKWSGKYCTISHNCTCSSNSKCIGLAANNRSICICRLNQFGSRCLLNRTSCSLNDNSTCLNGGQCIPLDTESHSKQYICLCSKGFHGDRCKNHDRKLILSFENDVAVSQSVLIHFIDLSTEPIPKPHQRATTFGTIITRQKPLIIFWPEPFLMIFTEFIGKNYYLTYMQKSTNRSTDINITTISSNRCPSINELFNETIVQWHPLRRIKYYHLPCQNQERNLSCFYDENHFCLCYPFDGKRLANCFSFDHNLKYNCYGSNECENDGLCFQDNKECPKRSICQCKQCSFGRRCQFVTDSFGLSLDAILAYHISSHLIITQQSAIIKFSLILTIIFIITGLIDSFLSLITFKNKSVREVGCGIYLLCSSINNILIIIIFGLKFFILLFTQMTFISNRRFLTIQCYSLDFFLRICLYMNQWLNACVAVERTMTIIKDIYFDKKKSQQAAKWIILFLIIIIIGTSSHDSIYRRLIDEKNDDNDNDDELSRIWCVITYSSTILEKYNFVVHIFHFFVPFIINIISSIILITTKSRQQTRIQRKDSYKQILRKQIGQYKHLLIAPIILIILALPRLILVFISKCMGSVDDAWMFLSFYFISFIPSMLNFVVFILPSEFYKNEFRKSIVDYRKCFQCCSFRKS